MESVVLEFPDKPLARARRDLHYLMEELRIADNALDLAEERGFGIWQAERKRRYVLEQLREAERRHREAKKP